MKLKLILVLGSLMAVAISSVAFSGAITPPPKHDKKASKTSVPKRGTREVHTSMFSTRKTIRDRSKPVSTLRCEGSVTYLKSLGEVTSEDVAIVIATPTQAFADRQSFVTYRHGDAFEDSEDHPVDFWTEGNMTVETVLYNQGVALTPSSTLRFSEPVGLINTHYSSQSKMTTSECYELKQGSKYVLFLAPPRGVVYEIDNVNLGHFNIDGTDPEDEIGGGFAADGSKTLKQKLREELMAPPYNVVFQNVAGARIVSARYINDGPPAPNERRRASEITVLVDAPQTRNSVLVIEKQSGDGAWQVINQVPVKEGETVVRPISDSSEPYTNDSLRVRVLDGNKTSNYSTSFPLKAGSTP